MRKPFSFIYTIHFVYQANKFYAFVTDFYRYCDNYSYVPSKSNAVILILSYSSHGICRKGIHKMGLHDILVDFSETSASSLQRIVKKNTTMYRIFGYLKLRIKAIKIKKKKSIE